MKKTIFVLLVVLVHVVACASSSAPSAPAAVRTNAPGELTPAFQAMRTLLVQGSDARQRCDAPFLRCLSPRLAATGLALLRARMPHDLRRADVARYHEGRAVFGGALKV